MPRISQAILALFVASVAAPVAADEVWDTPYGPIIYESDERGAAIFSFTNDDGSRANLIIPGLANNLDARGIHTAYWIGKGRPTCDASLGIPGQVPSTQWGRAEVIFDRTSYPTSLTLKLGYCFDPLTYVIRGQIR